MQKTSKVLVASFNRTFNGQYGQMFVHQIMFENGDSGEYNSKTQEQNKFVVGQEATYELTPNANPQYAPKITPVNPEFKGGGGFKGKDSPEQRRSIERQTSMNRAIDLAVARIAQGKEVNGDQIRLDAIWIYDWIARGETAKEQTIPPYQQTAQTEAVKTGIPGVTEEDQPPF